MRGNRLAGQSKDAWLPVPANATQRPNSPLLHVRVVFIWYSFKSFLLAFFIKRLEMLRDFATRLSREHGKR